MNDMAKEAVHDRARAVLRQLDTVEEAVYEIYHALAAIRINSVEMQTDIRAIDAALERIDRRMEQLEKLRDRRQGSGVRPGYAR